MNVKLILLSLLTLNSSLLTLSAAVPLRWTVDLAAQPPQVYSLQRPRGETYELEAVLQQHGKPFAPSITNACIYWQTNGMENLYWSAPATISNNVLRAYWLPEMDPGATAVRGYIGDPGNIYAAAFQLRFIASPGAVPNTLPLPVPILDYARVRVLNPPWPTNSVSVAAAERIAAAAVAPVVAEVATIPRITESNDHEGWAKCADYAVDADYAMEASEADRVGGYDGLDLKNMDERIYNNAADIAAETTARAAADTAHDEALAAHTSQLSQQSQSLATNAADIAAHKANANIHVTAAEKSTWNAKLSAESDPHFAAWTNRPAVSVGKSATSTGTGVAIGQNTSAVNAGVAVGAGSKATGANGVVVGNSAQAAGLYSAAFGPAAKTGSAAMMSVQLGSGTCNADNTLQFHDAPIGKVDAFSQSKFTLDSEVVIPQVEQLNLGYSRLYNFSIGATNANFTATNYPPTKAEADARCHFEPEPGMDFSKVPSSLQLNEYRNGEWRTVVDSRDWAVWYFKFKERQLTNEIARLKVENAALSNRVEAAKSWADRTANGIDNPMTDTVVVDRPNMWIMADYEWQKVVSGSNQCFVIRAKNVALSGGGNTNGFLEVVDAFGKPYMRINKSAETFAEPIYQDIYFDDDEGAWYVVFSNSTKPTKGGANIALRGNGDGKCIFFEEADPECPAVITWPDVAESHSGHWIMKAVPKPVNGVIPNAMFFGAEIKVPGSDYVEYLKEASFGAGIRYGNNVYQPQESGNQLIFVKRND